MDVSTILGLAARVAFATPLIVAGAAKLTPSLALQTTLAAFRVPHPATFAIVVSVFELLAGFLAILGPRASVLSIVPALIAYVAFAAAGALSLARKVRVSCNCFGGGSKQELGWKQIWLLALWLPLFALCLSAPSPSTELQVVVTAGVVSAYIAVAVRRSRSQVWALRYDRLAIPSYRQEQL